MSCTSFSRVGTCSDLHCHWSFGLWQQRFPYILCFRYIFLCVFYDIYIQGGSLPLWLDLTFRKIDFGTLIFGGVLVRFREWNDSVWASKCSVIVAFFAFPALFSLESSTPLFVPGNFGHHFSEVLKRAFCVHCCLIV